MNAAATPGTKPYYYVPQPSHWPITGSCALLLLALGATCWGNSISFWPWLIGAGVLVLLVMLFGWVWTVIGGSGARRYKKKGDPAFRRGLGRVIFRGGMFFSGFFGA